LTFIEQDYLTKTYQSQEIYLQPCFVMGKISFTINQYLCDGRLHIRDNTWETCRDSRDHGGFVYFRWTI